MSTYIPFGIILTVLDTLFSYGSSWEKLVEHQEILSLMIVSFILITCMVD